MTTPTHTQSAPKKYFYGTPEEVSMRLEHGIAATESHFTQIRPSTKMGPSINDQTGSVIRNGKMGRDLHHSPS